MRPYNIFITAIALLAFIAPTRVVAQEHKHVEVTTLYSHDLAQGTKLVAPPSVAEDSNLQPEIEYTINTDIWQINLDDHYFDPARASYWDYSRPIKTYLRTGLGMPGCSDIKFRYTTQNVRVGYFSVGLTHDGNFSARADMDSQLSNNMTNLRKVGDSFDMRNGISMVAGTFLGSQMLEVDANINLDSYNRYAERTPEVVGLGFQDIGFKLTYGDNFSNLNRLNFGIDLHGGYWAHEAPGVGNMSHALAQYNAGGALRFARNFGVDTFGVKLGGDIYKSMYTSYNDLRISLEGEYSRNFGFATLESVLGYMFDKVKDSAKATHTPILRAKALFDSGYEFVTPYIELNTTLSQNSAAGLYRVNPYIDYNVAESAMLKMPNSRSYDLAVGVVGSLLSSKLTYRLYAGRNSMKDMLVWYVTANGNFGVDTTDNKRLFFGAEVGYNPLSGLMLTAKIDAHKDNYKSEYKIDAPRFCGEFMAEYEIKRFRFYASANMVGKREWSAEVESDALKTPMTIDVRAGMSVRATSKWKFFIDGFNLLNNQIYNYAYYYQNGMGCMAGVEIDF